MIGLVLGAGGTLGAAWIAGALEALTERTGWDPGSADVIVGTSAGSVMGALLACGVPPWHMAAHQRGERFPGLTDRDGRPAEQVDRTARWRLAPGLPRLGPGSWPLALRSVTAPHKVSPAAAFTGWAPRGVFTTDAISAVISSVCPGEWAPHDGLRIVACDYATGRRVAFGAPEAPAVPLPTAVAASCAIPAVYAPVSAAGRTWVDGGIWSPSNLDLLRGHGCDLVIALSPMSTRDVVPGGGPVAGIGRRMRRATGARLGVEARRLRAEGTEVVILQPGAADLKLIGVNAMNPRRRAEVARSAHETVRTALNAPEIAAALARLPPVDGPLVRRPAGDPATWPTFSDLAAERHAA